MVLSTAAGMWPTALAAIALSLAPASLALVRDKRDRPGPAFA
jgi:hypothetical protein